MTLLLALLLAQSAHPCVADAEKLCPGVKPGQGRVAQCLKSHQTEMSDACKQHIAEFREEAKSCQADVEKLCPGAKAGRERHECMRAHQDQVSPECKEFFAKAMEHRGEVRDAMRACHADAQKLCQGVKAGEGRMVECLKQHQAELSAPCAAALQ